MQWARRQSGFTIVEFLIVVVVIAILAAVTIVAYNGIRQRADDSAVQSAVSQISKQLLAYSIENNEQYPNNLSSLGVQTPSDTEYVYTVDNATNPKSYCISATKNGVSFSIFSPQSQSVSGKCTITNLMTNPSLDISGAGWTGHSSSLGATRVQESGNWLLRGTRTDTAAAAMHANMTSVAPVVIGKNYTASALVSSSHAQTLLLQIRVGGTGTITQSQSHTFTIGESKRIWVSGPVASATIHITLRSDIGVVGESYTMDDVMLTEGSIVHPFADGDTPTWSWSGAAGLSTSSGPAL